PLLGFRIDLAVPGRGLRHQNERYSMRSSYAHNCQKITSVVGKVSPGRTARDRFIHSRLGPVSKPGLPADLLKHLLVGLRTEFVHESKGAASDLKIGSRVL